MAASQEGGNQTPESAAFPFLETLSPRTRESLLVRAARKSLRHKEVLAFEGRECVSLPLVLTGVLRVYKVSESGKELTLYRIERGESCVLTATCILNHTSFPAVAEAEGRTEVLLIPAGVFARMVEEDSRWRGFVFGLYSRRLEMMLTLVEEVAFQHVDTRLAAFLSAHGADNRGVVGRTHSEIASELGTSREVVTRILKDFEAEGLVATRRGRIEILRPFALEERARISSAP